MLFSTRESLPIRLSSPKDWNLISPIVALGASAGGFDALLEFFDTLPSTTGASFVVVQHLDRDHNGPLAEQLARKTTMPVAQIDDGIAPKPDHVFVIPPNTTLTLAGGRFHLLPREKSGVPHHPVDAFFESLAAAGAGAAIGVILSGGDSDGALGVKAIRSGGGITIAQSPESTSFPGMPQSAIDSGCVDFVLRPAEIANEIVRLSRHPYLLANGASAPDASTAVGNTGLTESKDFLVTTDTNSARREADRARIAKSSPPGLVVDDSLNTETEKDRRIAQLKLANQRKDEFLAMLAHELRNPLTPITHAVHLLQKEGFEGSPTVLHNMIERQTRRLVRLVDDLLDLARINRGYIELRNTLVDLTSIVKDAADSARGRAEERRLEITVAVPDTAVCVSGDAVRLEQIVSNLLDNAVKYTNPGGRIHMKLTEQGGEAVLSVRDNGIGIDGPDLLRIFDLFNQVDKSLSRSGGGLGIGLTLVRRVLQLHGGTVEARSAGVGQGAEFIVRLPVSEKQQATPGETVFGETGAATTRTSARGRRVLIVDDNADAVESMRLLAQHWGHEVFVAHSGPEAIAAVQTFRPETALVDIGLPGISGYEVARNLRPRYPDLFLVAMTGHGRDEDRKAARDAGFDAHVVKPADLDELQTLLSGGHVKANNP
jgi:signal transduction histidine kinase/chemotaxis response regulator CheB